MGDKVKIKMSDGTKRKGVIVGFQRDTDEIDMGNGHKTPGRTMETIQIALEPLEIVR